MGNLKSTHSPIKALIVGQPDQNFKFLGAQFLYQKVSTELMSLSQQQKV